MSKKYLCQECGCVCESCVNNNSLHLHREIELLKHQLVDRDYHIVQMETRVLRDNYRGGANTDGVREELRFWQDKYNRLYESHKKLQKVNQGLEDKLLKIVDKYETEKTTLTRDVTNLTSKLVDARLTVAELVNENEQYRNDCNVAVHLLQCKPSNFVAHKFSSLPSDLQEKVKGHINQRQQQKTENTVPAELRTIRVPISTFPPTAMVYSVSKVPAKNGDSETTTNQDQSGSPDLVSAAIMAKVLEERARERGANTKTRHDTVHKTTQTRSLRCICGTLADVHHLRQRSESSSSSDSAGCRTRNGSTTSTETFIV